MSQESSEPRVYSPSQAAKKLGISTAKLKYHRLRGDIEGTDIGNTTLYTEAQLKAANLAPKKPGPKGPRKKGDEGEQGVRDVSTTYVVQLAGVA
jgi:hypothetical protein